MNFRIPRLLAIVLAAALAVACTPGGGSIYFTLEGEVKVEDGSLPNAITVFDVAKVSADYYAAAGTIWTALAAAASFQLDDTVTLPTGAQLCTALAPFLGQLYGGFLNSSGNLGLYRTTALAFTPTPVADTDIAGAQIALLKVENSLLVAVAAKPLGAAFEYFAYTTPDGAAYTELAIAGVQLKPINDVIYAAGPFATPAWFATEGTNLYSGGGSLSLVTTTGITAGEELRGLFQLGSRLFLSSKAGAVYYSDDGVAWTRIEAPDISGAHPPLTGISGPLGGTHLLIGSDGYGYYRLDTTNLAAGPDSFTRFGTNTADLYNASVRKLVVDGSTVFALTSMGGLWRGSVSGTDVVDWKQE